MLRAITDEVVDKAIEVDEGQEALVVVIMLAMAVRTMAEGNSSRPVITASHMKSREERGTDQVTMEIQPHVIIVAPSSII